MLGQVYNDEDGSNLTEEDINSGELDRFMEEQEKAWAKEQQFQQTLTGTRSMSGAKAPLDWNALQADPVSWGPWQ